MSRGGGRVMGFRLTSEACGVGASPPGIICVLGGELGPESGLLLLIVVSTVDKDNTPMLQTYYQFHSPHVHIHSTPWISRLIFFSACAQLIWVTDDNLRLTVLSGPSYLCLYQNRVPELYPTKKKETGPNHWQEHISYTAHNWLPPLW